MLDIAVHAHGNFLICSSELVLQHFQKSKSFVSYQLSLEPSGRDGMLEMIRSSFSDQIWERVRYLTDEAACKQWCSR